RPLPLLELLLLCGLLPLAEKAHSDHRCGSWCARPRCVLCNACRVELADLSPLRVPRLVFYKQVASPFNFHLEQYDGPLDFLLDLIRKQQINIYDIPIASITQQYLEYMQRAMEVNI